MFRVVNENGLQIQDHDLTYKMPYQTNFEATRISEREALMKGSNRVITLFDDHHVYAMESQAIDDTNWMITVTSKRGLHVYKDKELTQYHYTLPKGCSAFAGARFLLGKIHVYYVYTLFDVQGYVADESRCPYISSPRSPPFVMNTIRGVLFGRILNSDGVLVRETKENYSDVIGVLNMDARVYIDGKDFSEVPSYKNVHKYRLAGGKGWINVYSQGNYYCPNVGFYGYVPKNVDMDELEMAIVPCKKKIEDDKNVDSTCISCMTNQRNALFLHENEYGHQVCCMDCANKVVGRRMGCPVCRLPIESVIQIF